MENRLVLFNQNGEFLRSFVVIGWLINIFFSGSKSNFLKKFRKSREVTVISEKYITGSEKKKRRNEQLLGNSLFLQERFSCVSLANSLTMYSIVQINLRGRKH